MNQLQIQEIIKEIAEKAKFGQIILKTENVDTYMSYNNVYYYEDEDLDRLDDRLEFSYDNGYLEYCTPCFRIDIIEIKNIVVTKDTYGIYEFRIEFEDEDLKLTLTAELPEGQTFTKIKWVDEIAHISIDQLFDILSKHETGVFIDINNRDLMENDCYNMEFQYVYFTNVMSINNNKIIAFTNAKQAPISNKNGTKLYHPSSETSLYINRVRINRIEKGDREDFNILFNTPLKAVYNIYLRENEDGLEDIVTVGLI